MECYLAPNALFCHGSKAKKEALEHFKFGVKIFPNRLHIFQNKLWKTGKSILKLSIPFPARCLDK